MMKIKMKCRFAYAILLGTLLVSGTAQAAALKVFLLAGQSNMDGRGSTSGLPTSPVNLQQPQTDVLLFEGGSLGDLQPGGSQFGPEVLFGRTIADTLSDEDFALIKYAVGGTNLHTDWNPSGGSNYNAFTNTVANGLVALTNAGHTYEIAGMLWTQGERDGKDGRTTAEYEFDLNEFIASIRSSYGTDLPFFFNRLSSSQTNVPETGRNAIRAAQENVAASDANAYMIDTDTFSVSGDNLHFDANGQIALGEAFGDAYLSTVPEPGSLVVISLGGLLMMRRRRD